MALKQWGGGLNETKELMLTRPPQIPHLQSALLVLRMQEKYSFLTMLKQKLLNILQNKFTDAQVNTYVRLFLVSKTNAQGLEQFCTVSF